MASGVKRREVEKVRRALEQNLMRAPNDLEMAEALEMDIRAYQDMNATIQPIRDEAIDEAYSDHLMDFADQGERADQAMEREQMASALKLAIDKLNEREQMILQLYFVEELNLDEIGQVLGVGAARVCQIKKSALTKVRAIMVEEAEDYA